MSPWWRAWGGSSQGLFGSVDLTWRTDRSGLISLWQKAEADVEEGLKANSVRYSTTVREALTSVAASLHQV